MVVHDRLTGQLPVLGVGATVRAYGHKRPNGDGRNNVQAVYQPPLGIFDSYAPMPSGSYKISLNPNSNFKKDCIQSLNPVFSPTYDVEIQDIIFYVCTVKHVVDTSVPMQLNLSEFHLQSKAVSGLDGNLEFTVPSSTRSLTLFIQNASGDANIPPTRFVAKNKEELSLTSFQLSFANIQKPSTRWSSAYGDNLNQLQQRYNDSMVASGLSAVSGGCETFREYTERGLYIHCVFTRDSQDRSTQAMLSYTFATPLPVGTNVFLASIYSSVCQITSSNGSIQEVKRLNA
jgi:hypothetical protein